MPREGVGVTLGAQVGHVVTYRGSPEGSLLYTVFAKKCQKRSKGGYPLFLTHFREGYHLLGAPTLVWPLGWQIRPPGGLPGGGEFITSGGFLEVGGVPIGGNL